MNLPEFDPVLTARLTFWVLFPFVFFAPRQWALIAWLIMANLDATGPSRGMDTGIGWMNAFKNLGLPLCLLFRFRSVPSKLWMTAPAISWMALATYAALASLWSSYPIAALKIVGNMVGILIILVMLEKAARVACLGRITWLILIAASFVLALSQTLVFGGKVYGFDGVDQAARLTSYVGAQQYAALLVTFLSVVLWMRPLVPAARTLLAISILVALVLNGSRTWLIGAFLILVIYAYIEIRRTLGIAMVAAASLVFAVLVAANIGLLDPDRYVNTDSRVIATATALLAGQDTPGNAGLRNLKFRTTIYRGLFDELSTATLGAVVLGHGTSTGGEVARTVMPSSYRIDPNRVVHNEWFRVQYEWGVVGTLLWSLTAFGILIAALRSYKYLTNNMMAAALLAYLPGLALASLTENIIAGAGSAVTIGFCMLLAGGCYGVSEGTAQERTADGRYVAALRATAMD